MSSSARWSAGVSRPFARVADYRELVERSTYRDDQVRAS
jgi:hypothetical protein